MTSFEHPSTPPQGDSLAHPWQSPPPAHTDPVVRASQYFRLVRQLAPQANWVAMANPDHEHLAVLTWIGLHIHHLNQQLDEILVDLLSCFQPQQQPAVQLFAAPLALHVGVDGFCNLHTQPITLVIDPSRVVPADWPHLLVHELAHAIAGTAGHGLPFYQALSYLCVAQDLPLPPANSVNGEVLRYWPPCRPNPQALGFWLGQGCSTAPIRSSPPPG
jgi:hypothetical protein